MRVRVRFRYNAESGEVETFVVEDLGGTDRALDHDARHDRVTADIARVVERDALIEEVLPGSEPTRVENPGNQDTPPERTDRRISE